VPVTVKGFLVTTEVVQAVTFVLAAQGMVTFHMIAIQVTVRAVSAGIITLAVTMSLAED
jgi:hypothetical protein